MLVLISICFIIIFKHVENVSWEEAIWQFWQTATTVGYGNKPAETTSGRWVTMIFGLVGIAVLGTIIGAVFDYRDEKREKRRLGLLENPFSNGVVIFNFPGTAKFLELITELRAEEAQLSVCIVDNKIDELPQNISVLERVHFIKGSIIQQETYKKANLKEARVVIVFPQDPSSSESDATTKVAVDMISKFTGEDTRIIHMLMDPNNSWLFKESKSTGVLEGIEILAMVQETHDPYIAPTIQHMLLNSEGANPMTVKSGLLTGLTWEKLTSGCLKLAKTRNIHVNPFAIIKDGTPDLCPLPECKIEENDYILVMIRDKINWNEYEKMLVKESN